jgi:hypothetical protein
LTSWTSANAQNAAPGELALDPEAAERALERTLVLRGQLLLETGQIEVEPALVYQHSDSAVGFVITPVDSDGDGFPDGQGVEAIRRQSDQTTAALEVRVGLPADSQFELRLPLIYEQFQQQTPSGRFVSDDSFAGLGDVRIGFAKTLARESGAVPDVVGRIAWDSHSGSDSDTLSLTTGFDEFSGSISAVRRLDPLVLTGGVVYETSLERDGVQPGDVFGFNFGTTLAASPDTALSIGFSAAFRQDTRIDGDNLAGSDQNEAFITFGISSVVRRNALLSVNFGAGLTEDSPDYFFGASLPIRFTAW